MQNLHIAKTIKVFCKSKGITISALLDECNLTKGFIYDLEKRDASPSCDKLTRIADYFDCSVDYLLGRTDKPDTENSELTSKNVKFIGRDGTVKYKKLSSEMIAMLEQLPDSDDKL